MKHRNVWTKLLALTLSVGLFTSLAACGKGGDAKPSGSNNEASQSQTMAGSGGNAGESVVAKGEALPILPEPKTYTAMVIQTSALKAAGDKYCVQKAAEETNISFEWSEVPSSGWTERINILFNTDSIPDVIIGDAGVSQNYEQLLTLDDYIDDYAPNVKAFLEERPEYNAALRAPDGKIHAFPIGDEAYSNKVDAKMWINTDWLDKLGLEMPTTLDEFENVLRAFKEKDPNGNNQADEMPLTFRNVWGWAQGAETYFGPFGVVENSSHVFLDKDNKVVFSPQEEGYKLALQWFNKLYKEGLLDPDAFVMSSDEYAVRDGGRDIVGALAGYNPSEVGVNNGENNDRYKTLPALVGPNGDQMVGFNYILRTDGYSINKNAEMPEALVRFYDYVNSSVQLKLEWGRGKEGDFWEWTTNDKGEKVPMFIEHTPEEWKALGYTSRAEYRQAESFAGQTPGLYTEELDKSKVIDPKAKTDWGVLGVKSWEPFAVYGLPPGTATPENSERRAILLTDIDNYLSKFIADSVMSGLTDEEWEQHLKTLGDLKVQEYVKLCQEYTDAVNSVNN